MISSRPRNINALHAAAILYGDWGTSKIYVIGLAFALAGYHSFWLIAAVCVLMLLVGFNYISICKFNPSGGGVYRDARKHSEILALAAALFLVADYLITASISALACFTYLGVAHPVYWTIGSILFLGVINFFGPRYSGNLALVVAISTAFMVVVLGVISVPFLKEALNNLQAPEPDIWHNWKGFVEIIVALSGIEAVANTTGIMRLDPGSSEENPSVERVSKRAILWVAAEVCFFTAFFGLMVNALPGLTIVEHQVLTPDHQTIRDSMLRYMGEYFVSHYWASPTIGYFFGALVSLVFGVLLLSAANTAIVALSSLLFIMSRDGEMPSVFQTLNRFGVPRYPLLLTLSFIIGVLFFVQDVATLANLYAVGFVGAIATHLGVVVMDSSFPLMKKERVIMWITFSLLVVVEVTLLITKPAARHFVFSFVVVGLLLRMLLMERRQKQWAGKKVQLRHSSLFMDDASIPLHQGAILCAVRTIGKTLHFALEEAKNYRQPLYILFIREQKIVTPEDRNRIWLDDDDACKIFDYAKDSASQIDIKFFYEVSDAPAETIVQRAKQLGVSRLILGRSRHNVVLQLLRGNIVHEISDMLPFDIDLLVIS